MIWNFHLANTRRQGKRKDKSKGDSGIDPSLNAVSYLQCMMNMRKEAPPVYTLKADAGPTQKGLMRFQIEVFTIFCLIVGGHFAIFGKNHPNFTL